VLLSAVSKLRALLSRARAWAAGSHGLTHITDSELLSREEAYRHVTGLLNDLLSPKRMMYVQPSCE